MDRPPEARGDISSVEFYEVTADRRAQSGSERLVALKIGDRVGDLTFVQPDGSTVTLAAFTGQPLLLIFLRHLA